MKLKLLITFIFTVLLLGGCFIYSFYPLYTEKDLFANSLLLGKWQNKDSTVWNFQYMTKQGENNTRLTDSTCYRLTFCERGGEPSESSMEVRVVTLAGIHFLDFYINEIKREDYPDFFDLHTVPVHTFARLSFIDDSVQIEWMAPEWFRKMAEENKMETEFLMNEDYVLLTAKTPDIQRFMIRYGNLGEAYKEGMNFSLWR